MASDSGQRSAPVDPPSSATTDGDRDRAVEDLPLPPYPPNLGPHQLHFLRQMRDPFGFIDRAAETGDVIRVRMPSQGDIYGFGHPDHFKRVLLTDREQFRKTEDFHVAFGEGLLTVEGQTWHQQRDVLQPLFTRDGVMEYADGMVDQIRRRTRRWHDGDRFDLQQEFRDLALDVLFATVLGRELDVDGDHRLRNAAESLNEWFRPTSYVLPHWLPTPARWRFKRGKARIRAEAERLLDERTGDAPTDPSEADDLLSLLVGLRETRAMDSAMLTDERLRDQMVTIIFAGHDTSATTLTFAFWALANNPAVRERFHAEVDALDGPPTVRDVADLDVTERIVTETLRLFPPVYMLPRETTRDVAFDGYRIPAGSMVNLAIRNVQRDERFFDDPETFRPSRWAGDLRSELPDFAYAPFGGGPRICIGRQFALLEAQLVLATVGREYKLYWLGDNDDDGEPPVDPQITTRMPDGQQFLVVER
ncbi:MAG: cytochrome P450 [Halorientalis sp.]